MSNEWKRARESMKKPNKSKKKKGGKKQRERSRRAEKSRRGKHSQAAFQSIIISWVLDMRERERNFAVVIIIITAIIIIRVIPVWGDGKADGKG